jgi:TolA-binding protein
MIRNVMHGWLICLILAAIALLDHPAPARADADSGLRDYLSATGLLNRGMNELAIAEYRKFLAAHPSHEKADLARYGLGVALYRTKSYAEAATELAPLAGNSQFEFAAEVQLVIGQSNLEMQKYAESAAALGTLLKAHGEHDLADDAAALQAEALYRAGEFKSVGAPAQLFASKWPQSPLRERAEFFSALALVAQEQFADAATSLAALKQRFPEGQFADRVTLLLAQSLHRTEALDEAVTHYQTVIERKAGDLVAEAQYGLASIHHQRKNDEDAGKLLDRMLKQFPQHRLASSARMLRGRVWFELGDFDQALASFEQADELEGTPRDESAYWIAKCKLRQGQFAEAAQRLEQALQQHPQSKLAPEMLYDQGVALKRADDLPAALKALAAFGSTYPSHPLAPDALYLQAVIEHEQRDYAPSRELCRTFAERFGTHALMPAVAFLAAENDFLNDQIPAAIEGYASFIAKYPKDEQLDKAKFRLGSAQYRAEKLDEAEVSLAAVVNGTKTPEAFRRGLLMLGDIRYQKGEWQKAANLLNDYLSFGLEQPSADDALLKRGLALAMIDRPDEALQSFDALIEKFPDSVHRIQAVFERGQVLLARKEYEAAATAFTQTLADVQDSRFKPYALNHLASIAMHQQKYEEAADLYAKVAEAGAGTDLEPESIFQRGQALMAAKKFETAGECFKRLIEQHPKSSRIALAQAQRAIALARQGEETEALKVIEIVEREHAPNLADDVLATVAYEKAWCLRELGRVDEAAKAYAALLEAHKAQPIAAHAMLELAEIESAAKRHDRAAELLSGLRDVAADPKRNVPASVKEQGLYRLAVAEFELGKFEQTATLSEQFIKAYPESKLLASAHLFAGEALFKLGKTPKAAEHFSAVVQRFADDPAYGPSLLRLGECHAAAGRWPDSHTCFGDYLAKFSDSELWFQAQFGLGFALENQQKLDDAIAAYKQVIERHSGPTAARAQFQIGECLFAKKQYDEAVRELLKVDILYGYPEWSAAALFEAGRCFEELAKPAEARSQFEQVKQKYPETQWAKLAGQRLTALSNRATGGG